MATAKMTLIGLYNYDNTLFNSMIMPEGIDTDLLINSLLLRGGEFEVLYPDPDFMKFSIGAWSRKQLPVWMQLWDTTQYEYNPIWNKDGKITETRDLKDENLNSVYGFNSSSEAPANKDESKATGTDTMEHTGKDTYNHTGTDTNDHTGRQDIDRKIDRDTSDTGTITRVEQGNIGVTSTQSLILEQREVVKLNMMDVIIHDFINRFCLKIY